jgi:hypothetical protein
MHLLPIREAKEITYHQLEPPLSKFNAPFDVPVQDQRLIRQPPRHETTKPLVGPPNREIVERWITRSNISNQAVAAVHGVCNWIEPGRGPWFGGRWGILDRGDRVQARLGLGLVYILQYSGFCSLLLLVGDRLCLVLSIQDSCPSLGYRANRGTG